MMSPAFLSCLTSDPALEEEREDCRGQTALRALIKKKCSLLPDCHLYGPPQMYILGLPLMLDSIPKLI